MSLQNSGGLPVGYIEEPDSQSDHKALGPILRKYSVVVLFRFLFKGLLVFYYLCPYKMLTKLGFLG